MKDFFKDKLCIYLDQFAVSNMVDNHPDWMNLKEILVHGFGDGKLICPVPFEHLMETSSRPKDRAEASHSFLSSLSNGYYFKSEAIITAQLLISKVRRNNVTANTFLTNKIKSSFSYIDSIQSFKKRKEDFKSMVDEGTAGTNSFKELLRTQKLNETQYKTMLDAHRSLATFELRDRLGELIEKNGIIIRGVNFKARTVAHWVDYLLDAMMKLNRMQTKEAHALLAHLEKYGYNQISTLDVRSTLTAYSAVMQKKETVNDQIDIMRISTGVQISDVMFLDKERKFEMTKTGLAAKYNTKLYSGTKNDIKECSIFLAKSISFNS